MDPDEPDGDDLRVRFAPLRPPDTLPADDAIAWIKALARHSAGFRNAVAISAALPRFRVTEIFQQLVNGLALGAIYALISLGYTMVYGVLRFINFAHSDLFMLGAYAGFHLAPKLAPILPLGSVPNALVTLLLAMGLCAGLGVLIEILAYRPLRDRPRLVVLITAIGVSLLIEYTAQNQKLGFGPQVERFPAL